MVYEKALSYFNNNSTELNADSVQFLERLVLTQAHRQHNREAYASYMRLLGQHSFARQTILSNLGFIGRRLLKFTEVKEQYKCFFEESKSGADNVFARSGFSICLRELDANPEKLADVWPSSIRYIDVNSALSPSPSLSSPFTEEPFAFAMGRQLESLLSVCSIPIQGDQSSRGIALVYPDPLNCDCNSRTA